MLPCRVTRGGCVTGWGGGCVTAHQQPHWFLWVSGLTCKTEPLALPSRPLPTSPPSSIGQLLQLESSARVYFHGWGAKTALSLFWLPCRSQWRRRGVLRTGVGPHRAHMEEDGGGCGGVRVMGFPLKQGARAAPGELVSVWRPGDGIPPLCFLLW